MIASFNGVKVFVATMFREHAMLGDQVTDWIRLNPDKTIVDTVVSQSSDSAYHCISITLFYRTPDCFPSKADAWSHEAAIQAGKAKNAMDVAAAIGPAKPTRMKGRNNQE